MHLNTIKPADGSRKKRKRVGRGIGSSLGKTAGRGHKGQKSRAGGFHKVGFEGGQMPLQRRLPKIGFRSYISRVTEEVRLNELESIASEVIDSNALKKVNLIYKNCKFVKVFCSGEIKKTLTLKGIRVTKGVRNAIEVAGGKIE